MPEIVLTTTISQIELAIEGKVDFVKKTNPFGNGKEDEEEKLLNEPGDPEMAMKKLLQMAKRRQIRDSRLKTKPKGR